MPDLPYRPGRSITHILTLVFERKQQDSRRVRAGLYSAKALKALAEPFGCPLCCDFANSKARNRIIVVFPAPGSPSTTTREFSRIVFGPGFSNTDFSVLKNTKLTEDLRLQFRAEVFDIFNPANFGQPGRVAVTGASNFGVITSARFPTGDSGSSRQVQFALKLIF